jgi:hypothetical protein
LCKGNTDANTVYSRAKRVVILENCLASKSFAAVREAFSVVYPENEAVTKAMRRLEQHSFASDK